MEVKKDTNDTTKSDILKHLKGIERELKDMDLVTLQIKLSAAHLNDDRTIIEKEAEALSVIADDIKSNLHDANTELHDCIDKLNTMKTCNQCVKNINQKDTSKSTIKEIHKETNSSIDI